MDKAIWQDYDALFCGLLELRYSPVAVRRIALAESGAGCREKKVRICRALLDAAKGQVLCVGKDNNACFGASLHLGFHAVKDKKIMDMVKKFVVEGEKLFSSYEALERLLEGLEEPPDNSGNAFVLAPLGKAEAQPELVVFVCDAQAACRLLTLAVFIDGAMPRIKIGGPTCRMSIIYPIASGEVNISFYDYTARKLCNVEKDLLLISVPYPKIPAMVKAIESCSAGRAKIEFPPEFRAFLQQRLAPPQSRAAN